MFPQMLGLLRPGGPILGMPPAPPSVMDQSGGLLMDRSIPNVFGAPSMPGTGPETRQAPPPMTWQDIWNYWLQRGQAYQFNGRT
jgi:hypothetical protein